MRKHLGANPVNPVHPVKKDLNNYVGFIMSSKITFYKMEGAGNDFIVIDNRDHPFPDLDSSLIARLCQRRFGIGADGFILLDEASGADFSMRYWNADGRPAEMCGNGARCALMAARRLGLAEDEAEFRVGQRRYRGAVLPGSRALILMPSGRVIMEASRLAGELSMFDEAMLWVDAGVPHLVVSTPRLLEAIDLNREGRKLRNHPLFSPRGVNVNFIQPIEEGRLRARVYERGVEGETLACGTGAVACAMFAVKIWNWPAEVTVIYPGGELVVHIDHRQGETSLAGPVRLVYSGVIDPEQFA